MNQQRLSAFGAEVVQPSCLVAQSAVGAFKMSNVHCFSAFQFKLAGPNIIAFCGLIRQVERKFAASHGQRCSEYKLQLGIFVFEKPNFSLNSEHLFTA